MIARFTKKNFYALCDALGEQDEDLKNIITLYGYPPFWVRPNTFTTLVLTILEQQVSLASAYAAFKKLQEKVIEISPENIVALTDAELRACYLSRQKIVYVRTLAEAFITKQINVKSLYVKKEEDVRATLKKLKGIGDWTVDIYLMHALRRTDIFPLGDLALVNALKMVKGLPATTSREELLQLAKPWQPYRTIATMLLWHYYIKKKNIKLLH